MCGIGGIAALTSSGRPPETAELRAVAGSLHHRGPDEFGVYRDARVGLAHARLSIIDLATGQQPLCNEDETVWIAFNGEIFNYVELREELVALGHRFKTRSDTEVIVHAWEAWGEEAFSRFNGQWAIALWDSGQRKLVLSRDRVGVRPLYLCEHQGRLYFASEVKAIFAADPAIPRSFDPVGLDQTLTFWTVVAPRTPFAGVTELEPGHVLIIDLEKGTRRDFEYWHPRYIHAFKGSIDDSVAAVRDALDKATRLRIVRADVPVGSYLSGGLDSSLIAALGVRHKGDRLKTFSMRFEDAEYDETGFQRAVVDHIGSDHSEIVVRRSDIAEVFPQVILHTERPILRTAPAPLFLLSRLVRQSGIKVVLTGEGADEMFAGYDIFREAKVRRFWARNPDSKLRPELLKRLYPYLARSPVSQQAMARAFFGRNLAGASLPGFSHELRWNSAAALKRLLSKDLRSTIAERNVRAELLATLPAESAQWSSLGLDQYLEVRTLLSGYLMSSQGDRMLMANSVEGRFPFLDSEVMELANSLPDEHKLKVLDEKHVLKRLASGTLPAMVAARKKQPYRAPDALSFVGPDSPAWIEEMMTERALRQAGVFEPGPCAALWAKCRSHGAEGQFSNADNMAVVAILSTQLLHSSLVAAGPAPRQVELRVLIER